MTEEEAKTKWCPMVRQPYVYGAGIVAANRCAKRLLRPSGEVMTILAIIPARSGSKGVPNKNIAMLGGYPLMAWSIMACRKSALIDKIVVSTDSKKYARIARIYGADVIMRPAEISGDDSTDYEFVQHALSIESPHLIAHIRPTTPFRDPAVIDEALSTFNTRNTSLRSVHEMAESAYKALWLDDCGRLQGIDCAPDDANNPRQHFKKTYSGNGYIDVLLPSYIRNANMLYGDRVQAFITPLVTELDTEEDFQYLEWQLMRHPEYGGRIWG